MKTTYELNNLTKDSDNFSGRFNGQSHIVEIFSAMVNGQEIGKYGEKADTVAKFIMELNRKAEGGDPSAISELNTLRKFIIEPALLKEIKLLGILGAHKTLGYDETVEREIFRQVGEKSRQQAINGDPVFSKLVKETYQVPTYMVSGGYAIDYRRGALGDMSKENEGMEQVRIDIRNKAISAAVQKIYNTIKLATGVKYDFEGAGLTKAGIDAVLAPIRRFGKPNVIGDYALLSQFSGWAGHSSTINTNTITGISEKVMNEIAQSGLMGMYNGSILSELPNPYDETSIITDTNGEKDFATYLPSGLGFVVPTGVQSPVMTWTKGGLTSFTGNNVTTGQIETRFDLECAVDVAKGKEHTIGVILDNNLSTL